MREIKLVVDLKELNKSISGYIHFSIDESNEAHLECDTEGLLHIAKCLLWVIKYKNRQEVELTDKLPRYWNLSDNGIIVPKYQYSINSTKKISLINTDGFEGLIDYMYKPTILSHRQIEKLARKSLIKKESKAISTSINIPDLQENEYLNINKPKNSFLWVRIFDDGGYIIGDTKGLNYLLKHFIYNCYIPGVHDSGFHTHLERTFGKLDNYSMDMGIYNIDFVEEKFRNDYYKYR